MWLQNIGAASCAQEIDPLHVLRNFAALAAYCQAYGRCVTAERVIATMAEKDQLTSGLMIKTTNGNGIQNPLIGTANKAAADMVRYAAEFGLTPVARARLALSAVVPQKSKFDGL